MEEQFNIQEEYQKLLIKYMTAKAQSESHRKSRDYHKELVAKIRHELSNYRSMGRINAQEVTRLNDELDEFEQSAKFWKTMAIFCSVICFAFMVLFFLEIRY